MNGVAVGFEVIVLATLLLAVVYALYQIKAVLLGAPYVRTSSETMEEMLALADLQKGTQVLELGSGNGELSIRAAEHGAIVRGVDVNRVLIWYARWRARQRHVAERVTFVCEDFLANTLPHETQVVFVYLLPGLMERTWPKLVKDLKPGTIVISHAFEFKGQPIEERRGKVIRYHIP